MRKDMKDMVNEIRNDEIEIFGQHKTREQIKTEQKARKAADRKAMREVAKARRTAVAEGGSEATRRDIIMVSVVIVVILALGIAALAFQFIGAEQKDPFEPEEGRTYFANDNAMPEESSEGITADLSQAYFTNGGYLCVRLLMANATETDMQVETVDIVLFNDTETIASAKVIGPTENDSDEPLVILADANRYYEFYIAPEHVFLPEDSLAQVGITYSIESTVLEE